MIKKLTISSLIITIILGVCALISLPFAVKNQFSLWENQYGKYYNYETSKSVAVNGIKNVNISSHQGHRIYGQVYQTNDKEIKIYYEGFSVSKPQITEQKDGETLNLQIDLEPVKEQQKNIFTAFLGGNGYLRFRIYVPKDLNVTLYCDNFTPVDTAIPTATEVMSANGKVFNEQYILTADDYYSQLKSSYGIIDNVSIPYTSLFEKYSYMMKDICNNFYDNSIERPIFLSVKDKIVNNMISSFQNYANENADICSNPEAKNKVITCATTYINAQTRLALITIEEGFWNVNNIDLNENLNAEDYNSNITSAISQLKQSKEDLMQSMTTTLLSRKNEVVNMLTFI